MASVREWQFKRKFRTNAYGWRASSFAIGRLKEAAAEIWSVAKRSNVWSYAAGPGFGRAGEEGRLAALHPTVKPVAMVADAILDVTRRGDVVLDPFLGSGTTLIACERVGRRCHGLELDPLYVDVIVRRWQAYTGASARLSATGETFDALSSARLSATTTDEAAA